MVEHGVCVVGAAPCGSGRRAVREAPECAVDGGRLGLGEVDPEG